MKEETVDFLVGEREITGCSYDVTNNLVVKPISSDSWTYTTGKGKTIWTPKAILTIPSNHNSRFSAKESQTAKFKYNRYKPITPLSTTPKVFIYNGLPPFDDWTLVLLNTEVATVVKPKDLR